MNFNRLAFLLGALLATFSTGCASLHPDPDAVTYFIDRTDFAGGGQRFCRAHRHL